ncbi:MAG TPA: SRPBCC family protein [Methylomirabilota bacterium]|nr:SRPBCC family protein [Methylomirabilota bacterium]
MNFEHHCIIPVARETLWRFLMDVPQMASCVPGVESITVRDDGQYAGRMRVKVGPIRLTLQGVLTIQEQDQRQWRAIARAEANDRRVGGGVHLTTRMTLIENGPTATELAIQAQARLLGKLGEFGQPVIRKQADAMIAEFARNVADRLLSAVVALRDEDEQAEHSVSRSPEVQHPVSSAKPFPARLLSGAAAGFALAILLLTILPTPASPLLMWMRRGIITAGVVALGVLVATGVRLLWKRNEQVL